MATGSISISLVCGTINKDYKGNESLGSVTVDAITGTLPSNATVTGGSLFFNALNCYQSNKIYWKVTQQDSKSTVLAQTETMPRSEGGNSMECTFTAQNGSAILEAARSDNLWLRFFGGGTANAINLKNSSVTLTLVYEYENPRTPSTCSFSSSVAAGSSQNITITSESSAYRHVLALAINDDYGLEQTIAAGVTSYSVTIPLNWCLAIPNDTSVSVGLALATYNGDTLIGTSTGIFTMTVPASVVPTLGSPTASIETGGLSGYYVQGKSKVRITAGAFTGAYGSTIARYVFSGPNLVYNGSDTYAVSDIITSSGTLTYTVTAVDSRGRASASATVSITAYEYSLPAISAYSAIRTDDEGTASESGTSILVTCACTCSSVNGANSVTWGWAYKKASDASWTTGVSNLASGAASRLDNVVTDTSATYQVRITATDTYSGTTVIDINVLAPGVVIFLAANGTAIGIGTKTTSETSGHVSKGALHVDISADWNIWHGDYLIPMIHVGSTAPSDTNALWLKPVS